MASTTTARKRAAAKPAPEPEVAEDDEFEDMEDDATEDGDDLEELEDEDAEVEADEKPKAKRTPPQRPKIDFGTPELAAHVTEVTGENYDGRAVRMLLRKMAKDPKSPVNREVGTDRARYEFSGPNDPIVKAVVAMVKSGEAKALKQEGLQAVKDRAAAKKAAAKKAEAETEDMEDVEDEVEDEKPAPKRTVRKAAPAKATAAPAKATPARRRAAAK